MYSTVVINIGSKITAKYVTLHSIKCQSFSRYLPLSSCPISIRSPQTRSSGENCPVAGKILRDATATIMTEQPPRKRMYPLKEQKTVRNPVDDILTIECRRKNGKPLRAKMNPTFVGNLLLAKPHLSSKSSDS
jgi:hypothetical protein